jgi:hypothetical protein
MNNREVAERLVKIAKELVAKPKQTRENKQAEWGRGDDITFHWSKNFSSDTDMDLKKLSTDEKKTSSKYFVDFFKKYGGEPKSRPMGGIVGSEKNVAIRYELEADLGDMDEKGISQLKKDGWKFR